MHGGGIIAVENMNENPGGLGVAGLAGVISGMSSGSVENFEPTLARQEVRANVHSLLRLETDHPKIVVPKKVRRRFRRLLHLTMQL